MEGSRIRIGGLMRCCIQTIREETGPDREGRIINCKYCKERVKFVNGAWEWLRRVHA